MPYKSIRRCFSLLVSVMLFACAGYKEVSYFSPVPSQDIDVAAGWRGLDEIVKYQIGETVELSLIIFDQPKHSSLRVIFNLPAGEVARFENTNLVVTPFSGGKSMVAKINTIQANYIVDGRGSFRYFTSEDDLEGASHEYKKAFGGSAMVPRNFQIDVEFPAPLPDHFQLRVPSLKLSGKTISLPEVEFRRKVGSAYQGSPP